MNGQNLQQQTNTQQQAAYAVDINLDGGSGFSAPPKVLLTRSIVECRIAEVKGPIPMTKFMSQEKQDNIIFESKVLGESEDVFLPYFTPFKINKGGGTMRDGSPCSPTKLYSFLKKASALTILEEKIGARQGKLMSDELVGFLSEILMGRVFRCTLKEVEKDAVKYSKIDQIVEFLTPDEEAKLLSEVPKDPFTPPPGHQETADSKPLPTTEIKVDRGAT